MVDGYVRCQPDRVLVSLPSRVLAGAGALALTAGTVALISAPLLLKAPIHQSSSLRATGPGTFLATTTGKPVAGTFVQTSTIRSHTGSATTVSYDQTQVATFVPASGGPARELTSSTLTHAFDRSTGQGRPGAQGDTVGTTAHLFKLPFHTSRTTYEIWDETAKRAVPLRFSGEQVLDGLRVYVFTRDVPATDLGVLPLFESIPGSYVGHPELPSIPADEWYETTDTRLYVEPVTGSLVGGTSSPHLWAQTTGRYAGLKVDLLTVRGAAPVAADAARLVRDAKHARQQVLLLQRAPWVLGGVGLVLLAVAFWLGRRRPVVRPAVDLPAPRGEAVAALDAPA
jgi:hypothetical protein